jgi:protein-tyrosine phosphatase
MSSRHAKHHILFVCLGNICRSPLAEGVFRHLVDAKGLEDTFYVDSCGTSGWHVGQPPDRRSVSTANGHGIDITAQRSRQLDGDDFRRFDWIVAMDGDNAHTCRSRSPVDGKARIVEFMTYVPGEHGDHVPDPYYGGDAGFERVYELLESGSGALLDAVLEG